MPGEAVAADVAAQEDEDEVALESEEAVAAEEEEDMEVVVRVVALPQQLMALTSQIQFGPSRTPSGKPLATTEAEHM